MGEPVIYSAKPYEPPRACTPEERAELIRANCAADLRGVMSEKVLKALCVRNLARLQSMRKAK